MMFTSLTQSVTPKAAKAAADAVEQFRANGGGSNRTNWARTEAILASVLVVVATGTPVDISSSVVATGSSSAYHLAHRVLSTDLLRPYWGSVQVLALKNAVWNGSEVTGESSTTRGETVLICPAA
jgi:hypothetical protein